MRLDDLDPSENVRDLGQGSSGGGFGGGGGNILLGLLPMLLGSRLGCGTIALIAIGVAIFMAIGGGGGLLTGGGTPGSGQQQSGPNKPCDTPEELQACRVMTSTEQTWGQLFAAQNARYQPPMLNFYRGSTGRTGCGFASSAAGPFYCPADRGVYLDTDFFQELARRFGAAGDFAQNYVIAHEIGHHIQNITGTMEQVRAAQARMNRAQGNALSVRVELQADCYAGVWAARNRDRLEAGDIEEGMRAAEAIGDDTLQKQAQGTVVPESFTHGTSAQRMQWLRRGLETGDPAQCDTFQGAI